MSLKNTGLGIASSSCCVNESCERTSRVAWAASATASLRARAMARKMA